MRGFGASLRGVMAMEGVVVMPGSRPLTEQRGTSARTEIGERGFDEKSGQSRALLVGVHRADHEVAVIDPHVLASADDPLVCGDSDNAALVHGDDRLSVSIRSVGVRPPLEESANDLRDLVKPQAGAPDVERFELLGVALASMTDDHASADSTAAIGPFGVHLLPVGFGPGRLRPPLARLRLGSTPGVSNAAESRWMVDHRASSRPFSIREISAWETAA